MDQTLFMKILTLKKNEKKKLKITIISRKRAKGTEKSPFDQKSSFYPQEILNERSKRIEKNHEKVCH